MINLRFAASWQLMNNLPITGMLDCVLFKTRLTRSFHCWNPVSENLVEAKSDLSYSKYADDVVKTLLAPADSDFSALVQK